MVLASQLKILIKKRGITVVSLSKFTNVPAKTIYSWLQNQSPRNLNQVKKIADYFEVSLDYLLFNDERIKKPEFEDFTNDIYAGKFDVILRRIKN